MLCCCISFEKVQLFLQGFTRVFDYVYTISSAVMGYTIFKLKVPVWVLISVPSQSLYDIVGGEIHFCQWKIHSGMLLCGMGATSMTCFYSHARVASMTF